MEQNKNTILDFANKLFQETYHDKFMELIIFVDSSDPILNAKYLEASIKHNQKIMTDPHFYDAGFDLFLPKNEKDSEYYGDVTRFFGIGWSDTKPTTKVDFQVKCCAKMCLKNKYYYTPFYTYARSSISRTPLRLANNQGIIDAGYRGSLIGMFDCIYNEDYSDDRDPSYYIEPYTHILHMKPYTRILQVCAPCLVPIYVSIVDKIEELGPNTSRGEGGFGSTGK